MIIEAGPPRRLLAMAACCALAIVGAGCEDDLPPGITKKAVAYDDVPAAVRDAARKAIPGVDLKEAWQNLDAQGKLHSYEVRGKNPANGKIREVRVSTTGEILESE
jgi:hypothetical protein